ncbi:hypothetical protein SO802_001381 [Lithocarpus litseifolius]|uniref:Uncharacterized protein n=1 Tax=Lithocarpus litseifolius TaxID=425828 RepID=A0AAW2DWX1_9ROSI
MEVREFRGFTAGGSSSTKAGSSVGKPAHLVESGVARMVEERSPLMEISNTPMNPKSGDTAASISSKFASAKLLRIRDCPIVEHEDAHIAVNPKLHEQLSLDSEMEGVACDTQGVVLIDLPGLSDWDAHLDAVSWVDDMSEVEHHVSGADEMHVEGDGSVLLSS